MNDEEKEIIKKFPEVYGKIKKEAPSKKSKKELEAYFIDNKQPSISIQKFSKNAVDQMIERVYEDTPMDFKQFESGIEEMRMELGYDNSSTIEQLLIDDIVIGFFHLRNMQIVLISYIATKGTADKKRRFIDHMVSSAQRRFYKSIQTLMRLRKTGINLQINIATDGESR